MKVTTTILIDNENYRQWPKFVDLLKRDGQNIPTELLNLSKVNIIPPSMKSQTSK